MYYWFHSFLLLLPISCCIVLVLCCVVTYLCTMFRLDCGERCPLLVYWWWLKSNVLVKRKLPDTKNIICMFIQQSVDSCSHKYKCRGIWGDLCDRRTIALCFGGGLLLDNQCHCINQAYVSHCVWWVLLKLCQIKCSIYGLPPPTLQGLPDGVMWRCIIWPNKVFPFT